METAFGAKLRLTLDKPYVEGLHFGLPISSYNPALSLVIPDVFGPGQLLFGPIS